MGKNEKPLMIAILFLSTFLGALGQLFFKIAMGKALFMLAGFMGIGIAMYLISTVFYFNLLSKTNLSWAYSFGGLSYIFVDLLALLVLNEPVSPVRWAGVLVIAAGVALIGLS